MEAIVIEDPDGRYRVTFEADDELFRQALGHEFADLVLDLLSRTGLGTLIQGGLWPDHFMVFLTQYMDEMQAMLADGGVELDGCGGGSGSPCQDSRPRTPSCCGRRIGPKRRLN
jgi:hypothetical protein